MRSLIQPLIMLGLTLEDACQIPQMLAVNGYFLLGRKQAMDSNLLTAIAAAISHCPCCNSNRVCALWKALHLPAQL